MDAKFAFAKNLIKQAGDLITIRRQEGFSVDVKGRFDDLVTNIDKEVQDYLIEAIQARYPEDSFLAEESDEHVALSQGSVWVIDPIDGTTNFIVQGYDFAVMMAYFEDGIGQFGLIYDVMNKKLYAGGGQFPVTLNDSPLLPIQEHSLERSLLAGNSRLYAENIGGVANLVNRSLGLRTAGSAGISFGHVLEGRLLGYFSSLYPWDYAAGMIMGETLGYRLVPLLDDELDGQSRQEVIFLPDRSLYDMMAYLRHYE